LTYLAFENAEKYKKYEKKTKLFSNFKQVSLSEYAQIKQLLSEIFIFILATM